MNLIDSRSRKSLMAFAMVLCFVFVGCKNGNDAGSEADLLTIEELEEARNLWRRQEILDYDMVASYEPHGQLPAASPVLIKVRKNQPVSIERLSNGKGTLVFYEIFNTVDKMFDRIIEALDDGATVTGSFDPTLGYPKKVSVIPKTTGAYYRLGIDKLLVGEL